MTAYFGPKGCQAFHGIIQTVFILIHIGIYYLTMKTQHAPLQKVILQQYCKLYVKNTKTIYTETINLHFKTMHCKCTCKNLLTKKNKLFISKINICPVDCKYVKITYKCS